MIVSTIQWHLNIQYFWTTLFSLQYQYYPKCKNNIPFTVTLAKLLASVDATHPTAKYQLNTSITLQLVPSCTEWFHTIKVAARHLGIKNVFALFSGISFFLVIWLPLLALVACTTAHYRHQKLISRIIRNRLLSVHPIYFLPLLWTVLKSQLIISLSVLFVKRVGSPTELSRSENHYRYIIPKLLLSIAFSFISTMVQIDNVLQL